MTSRLDRRLERRDRPIVILPIGDGRGRHCPHRRRSNVDAPPAIAVLGGRLEADRVPLSSAVRVAGLADQAPST